MTAQSSVREWSLTAEDAHENGFTDVVVRARFSAPSGAVSEAEGFFDGDGTWRVRFTPRELGRWHVEISSLPWDRGLHREETFEVAELTGLPFLRSTPEVGWGFSDDRGVPQLIVGDTTYHLVAWAYCGIDVEPFLRRRAEQGFNLLRVRVPVSPFHPPAGHNVWQDRSCWPWGGSEQYPLFDRFNLDYFRVMDGVVQLAESLGIRLELVMEAWSFEFPFNDRGAFTAEWEELWLRYLLARYDASPAVAAWTPMNEYEFYPKGTAGQPANALSNRWMLRVGRLVRDHSPHGHVLSVHNGPQQPRFAERFAIDPTVVDTVMLQDWGDVSIERGWLAEGLDTVADDVLTGWHGSAVLAEYGYEANMDLERAFAYHDGMTPAHTRRGAWRGSFLCLGVITGFENTWGPWAILDADQPGMAGFLHWARFFTEVLAFDGLRRAPELVAASNRTEDGTLPLALEDAERHRGAVYLPTGGTVTLAHGVDRARWYDPRTGESTPAVLDGGTVATASSDDDWVLYWA